jgi:hypothetical protein
VKLKSLEFESKAILLMSMEDISLLMELSKYHYDSTCKSIGQDGGFLYGFKNHEEFAPGSEHELTNRQIQLLMKILELPIGIDLQEQAYGILQVLKKALLKMAECRPKSVEF